MRLTNEMIDSFIDREADEIANSIRASFLHGLKLRVKVYIALARDAGCEIEDEPGVMQNAIATGLPIIKKALDDMADIDRATIIAAQHQRGDT